MSNCFSINQLVGQNIITDRSFAIKSKKSRCETKMASALRPIKFWFYYERERKIHESMCGFYPYETREYTKHTNQINQDGARCILIRNAAADLPKECKI